MGRYKLSSHKLRLYTNKVTCGRVDTQFRRYFPSSAVMQMNIAFWDVFLSRSASDQAFQFSATLTFLSPHIFSHHPAACLFSFYLLK
jgi:hypothetical protein